MAVPGVTSVRRAVAADAEAIAAIQQRAWQTRFAHLIPAQEQEQWSLADLAQVWEQACTNPPSAQHVLLVATTGVHVVGYALLQPGHAEGIGELVDLVVDPDAQRLGHGSRLLNAAIDTMLEEGFSEAECWLHSQDEPIRTFLFNSGWAGDGATRALAQVDEPTIDDEIVPQIHLVTAIGDPDAAPQADANSMFPPIG